MKINYSKKPAIWQIPHYYLCWNKIASNNMFFIFTSNFFNLFLNNIAGPEDVKLVQLSNNLPFKKSTYIVLCESYNISDITEVANMIKISNAFGDKVFGEYQHRGLLAKNINIKGKDCVIIKKTTK